MSAAAAAAAAAALTVEVNGIVFVLQHWKIHNISNQYDEIGFCFLHRHKKKSEFSLILHR